MRPRHAATIAVVALLGCETYEFPPRLAGVGPDDTFELSETRVPPGVLALEGKLWLQDERGAIEVVMAYVTTPSGEVLERPVGTDDTEPGFVCRPVGELSDQVGVGSCEVSSSVGRSADRLFDGLEQAELMVGFGVVADELGTWGVEVVAVRSNGTESNRLQTTFEVADDIVPEPERE